MAAPVASAVQALLERLIDYAGTFPPAALPREDAVANFERYRQGPFAWMLRHLVVSQPDLASIPKSLDGALSVLSDNDEPRAPAIETKRIFKAARPTYSEVPIQQLDEVQRAGCFAKLRTGGVKPEAIPSVEAVADFIRACAERRLPFKATAGLHHPIRASQFLTYEPDAPRAVMHGFLNVFLAACFAWHGQRDIEPIIAEIDPTAFSFNDHARWGNRVLSAERVRDARLHFAHAFGSCSFEEPVRDLQALGFL